MITSVKKNRKTFIREYFEHTVMVLQSQSLDIAIKGRVIDKTLHVSMIKSLPKRPKQFEKMT